MNQMSKSIVFMFSGQGSQYYQMGKDLFDQNPVFRNWMRQMDDQVREISGRSVLNLFYNDKKPWDTGFDRTSLTHPAIFMVEYALAQTLLANGVAPDFVMGTSMGEFAAAVVAGVMELEAGLECLLKQAESFESLCEKGGMLAIIDNSALFEETPVLYENSELASVNYDAHFVVSGRGDGLLKIKEFLKSKEILYQDIPVSHAFHSSRIDPAAAVYREFLRAKSLQTPRIPLVSCLQGRIISRIPGDYFWEIARQPIRLPEAVRELEKAGSHFYLDLGPSGTLANFVKRNFAKESRSETFPIMTQFNRDVANLEKIIHLF
jgi:trans-AT polyketide synthase, acyltransferase and oxidoreductase domains